MVSARSSLSSALKYALKSSTGVSALIMKASPCRPDERAIVYIVFIVNFADDFLQHILDGDQAGHTAILVHHNGHVQAAAAKFLQQDVKALAFGDELGGSQQGAQG